MLTFQSQADSAATLAARIGLNPVVETAELSMWPGWTGRRYADGSFDATHENGLSVSPMLGSAAELASWLSAEFLGLGSC